MAGARSILVVDDDIVVAETLTVLLRACGYEAFAAFNGLHGCQQYFNCPTELVATDIQMPEMNGFEMVRYIRSINPDVKVIYLSGSLERFAKDIRLETRRFGVASLRKPTTTKTLMDVLSSFDEVGQHAA
jgi:CheY-like chemotaxis protein